MPSSNPLPSSVGINSLDDESITIDANGKIAIKSPLISWQVPFTAYSSIEKGSWGMYPSDGDYRMRNNSGAINDCILYKCPLIPGTYRMHIMLYDYNGYGGLIEIWDDDELLFTGDTNGEDELIDEAIIITKSGDRNLKVKCSGSNNANYKLWLGGIAFSKVD